MSTGGFKGGSGLVCVRTGRVVLVGYDLPEFGGVYDNANGGGR